MLKYNDEELRLRVMSYAVDSRLMAVQSVDSDGFPYATLTVNLGHDVGGDAYMPKDCAFLDENNVPGIGTALYEAGIAAPYLREGRPVLASSGYCVYPLYQFDGEKLAEMDPGGYAEYSDGYDAALTRDRRRAAFAGFDFPEDDAEDDFDF